MRVVVCNPKGNEVIHYYNQHTIMHIVIQKPWQPKRREENLWPKLGLYPQSLGPQNLGKTPTDRI